MWVGGVPKFISIVESCLRMVNVADHDGLRADFTSRLIQTTELFENGEKH